MSDRARTAQLGSQADGEVPGPARRRPRRALVVDDNDSAREVLKKLLLAEAFECDVASSGSEALSHIADRTRSDAVYDVIFVDLVMPVMSGLELTSEIRTRDERVAIVVVTGVDDVSQAREALRLGADEYVVKPYSISQLRLAREQAFERRRQLAEQKRVERTRDELTELIFHDLRSPLTAARGYLSLMELDPDAIGPGDIAAAVQGCDLAVDIIEHGEYLGRIERSEIEVKEESLRLGEIVPALVESLRPLAEGAGRRICVACADGLPAAVADESLVKKVASALIVGAIKYASGKACILVELSASRGSSEVLLAVTDDGFPVAPDLREAIFDKHSQGELKRAGSRRGRGLALPFAREACRRMGARIWVEDVEAVVPPILSTDGPATDGRGGCRFVVAFRAAPMPDVEPARPSVGRQRCRAQAARPSVGRRRCRAQAALPSVGHPAVPGANCPGDAPGLPERNGAA